MKEFWKGRHSSGVTDDEPHERLSRIGDAMFNAAHAHPEWREGDRLIIMLDEAEVQAFCANGYESPGQMITAALIQINALIESQGGRMHVIPMPHGGEG